MTRFVACVSLIMLIGVLLTSAMWSATRSVKSQPPDRIVGKKPWPNEPVTTAEGKPRTTSNRSAARR